MKIPLHEIKCYYGEERFKELDRDYIEKLKQNTEDIEPIIISCDNFLIDGHHRYIALKESGKASTEAIKLDIAFKYTDILRDFQKHLKNMVPEEWSLWNTHNEFKKVIVWIIQHSKKE